MSWCDKSHYSNMSERVVNAATSTTIVVVEILMWLTEKSENATISIMDITIIDIVIRRHIRWQGNN